MGLVQLVVHAHVGVLEPALDEHGGGCLDLRRGRHDGLGPDC